MSEFQIIDRPASFLGGFIAGMIILFILTLFLIPTYPDIAEFICESQGTELIDYEIDGKNFSKVECGQKKPELQYDNYKVFEK